MQFDLRKFITAGRQPYHAEFQCDLSAHDYAGARIPQPVTQTSQENRLLSHTIELLSPQRTVDTRNSGRRKRIERGRNYVRYINNSSLNFKLA